MAFMVNGFIDTKRVINQLMEHIPQRGDILLLSGARRAKVTSVEWLMNEDCQFQKVHFYMQAIKDKP